MWKYKTVYIFHKIVDNMVPLKLFVCTLVLWISYTLAREVCDVKDPKCSQQRAKDAYPLFIDGVENLVESSDPVEMEYIKGTLPTVKYEFKNAKLSGLRNCDVTKMTVVKETSTFKFHLHCPQIQLNTEYSLLGYIADYFVEGDGTFTVTCDDYLLKFNGKYKKVTGKDENEHVHIKNYYLEVEPRGSVVFDFKNLYGGKDPEKSDAVHKHLNKNWKDMDKALRAPALYTFMDVFIAHLNSYLGLVPVAEVFPELAA